MPQKIKAGNFDRNNWKPVIYGSVASKNQVAGFKELQTGQFTEIMTIHNGMDVDRFLEEYDISVVDIINK